MIDTQAIRSKILYLALRGKLTHQNPLEGSGHSLLEDNNSILSTCSDDIKKRVGKGCKPIKPEDSLFEIPESWCWERFGNLVINFDSLRQPVTKSERKKLIGRYDYYGATGAIDRVDDYIFDGDYLMIGEDGGNFFVNRDNSFIARGRFWANNHVHVVRPIICDIVYLKRCLDTYDLPKMGLVYGIGAPKLNQAKMNSIPIPIPPLAEQHRIVEKIDQAFSLLDTIDTLQAQYADNLTVLKTKLLKAAIQGKLTTQLPEDGTAEDLYRQIQAQKQALIKAGKLKKRKPQPEITDNDIPFAIPSNWKWVPLGELISIESGRGLTAAEMKPGTIPVYGGNGISGHHDCAFVPEGTVVIGRVGYYCGSVHVTEQEAWVTDNAFITTYPEKSIDKWFLVHALRHMKLGKENNGAAQPVVSGKKIYPLAFPLPPLAEQKRIAAKLEALLPLCEMPK